MDSELINRERIALEALADYGAVPLLNYQDKALLLKKLSPAISLKTKNRQALKIACEVINKLHQAPLPTKINLPSIEERFALLDKAWPISQAMLIKARICRDYISKTYTIRKVLHGDLHYDNILQEADGWKVIDPHGVIGFPINEIWHLVQDINSDVPFIAKYFGYMQGDIIKCYFIHSLLAAIWAIEDNLDPKLYLDMASKAYNLLN